MTPTEAVDRSRALEINRLAEREEKVRQVAAKIVDEHPAGTVAVAYYVPRPRRIYADTPVIHPDHRHYDEVMAFVPPGTDATRRIVVEEQIRPQIEELHRA